MCPSNLTWSTPYDPPIRSIKTNHNLLRFQYSPDFCECPDPYYRGSVIITMTGSRPADFRRCNEAAHLSATPSGYTWHHKYMVPYPSDDHCEMQLVRTEYHRETFCHAGGFIQFINRHKHQQLIAAQNRADDETQEYLFQQANLLAGLQGGLIAAPLAAADVERLSESLQISLPAGLRDFYRDGHKITPVTPFLTASGCTYLISSVYPFAQSGDTTETLQTVMEYERQRAGGPLLFAQNGAIPIADDPFGNIYFLPPEEDTVYVYDHECDMAFSTHIPVGDFIDNLYSREA